MLNGREGGVVLVAPPWPRCGSSNIFANQVGAHMQGGRRVFLLLGPTERAHAASESGFWADAVAAMSFPGAACVDYGRTGDTMRPLITRSFYDWMVADMDDAMSIMARVAGNSRLPPSLGEFLHGHPIDVVHVNHAFEMILGAKVAMLVSRKQGSRPLVVCDTQDVQSDAFLISGRLNPFTRRTDEGSALLRAELSLLRQADVLVHYTKPDLDFFAQRLPAIRHELVPPAVAPETEQTLRSLRGARHAISWDFVYIGNHNVGNLASVTWLLREIFPRVRARSFRIAIVGRVAELVRRYEPQLFAANASLFFGEVDDIAPIYSGSRIVLAPAIKGTGASIKLIEALCAGRSVIATTLTARGLPEGSSDCEALSVCDAPDEFAAAMVTAADSPDWQKNTAAAAFYERHFSSDRYRQRMIDVIDAGLSRARHLSGGSQRVSAIEQFEELT